MAGHPVPLEATFDAFFEQMYPRALRAARRLLGDIGAAEEASADAFAAAYASWSKISTLTYRDAWVMRVTMNRALGHLRRRRVTINPPALDESHEDAVVLRAALVEALKRLPRRQRQCVALRYLAGLSESEVAASLGLSGGSVKTHVYRGLASLRAVLGPKEADRELGIALD